MRLCVTSGCLVLPREVAVIEAANIDGVPLTMGNLWYQFVHPHGECGEGRTNGAVPCKGFVGPCGCCGCHPMVMQDQGTMASFARTTSDNCRLRFYPGNAADVGKKIIVQGYDSNNIWVRTTIDGVRADGEQVTLALPYVETVTVWNPGAPTGVIKEQTAYRVLVYAADVDDGTETPIAEYQPSETEPMYRVVNIPNYRGGNCGCGSSGTQTLLAVVSLQNIPLQHDNDWLLFTNLSAYKAGMMAEKMYESGDVAMGDAYFFGTSKPARNARGVLRVTDGMGALPLLRAELRKQTGDQSVVDIKYNTLDLAGFR